MKLTYFLAGLAGVVAVLLGLAWTQQRRLLYFPEGDPGPPPAGWTELVIPGRDLELTGWHRAGDADEAPLVIVYHGNGGNRAGRVPLGDALASRGFDVLLVDYRGYGGNPGTPGEQGLTADALAAAELAEELAPGRPVVYLGESLGAAVAVALAVSDPPDALVLISPFTSVADVGRFHYPMAPSWLIRERYPSLERINGGRVEGVPTLVIAGDADTIVPADQSRRIADAAGAEWHEVPGADHNDPALRSAPWLADTVADFLSRSI